MSTTTTTSSGNSLAALTHEQYEHRIADVIKNILENKGLKITQDSHLERDLAIDSMSKVMVMNDLEDEFKIKIGDDEFNQIHFIDEIVKFVIDRVEEMRKLGGEIPAHVKSTSHFTCGKLPPELLAYSQKMGAGQGQGANSQGKNSSNNDFLDELDDDEEERAAKKRSGDEEEDEMADMMQDDRSRRRSSSKSDSSDEEADGELDGDFEDGDQE